MAILELSERKITFDSRIIGTIVVRYSLFSYNQFNVDIVLQAKI